MVIIKKFFLLGTFIEDNDRTKIFIKWYFKSLMEFYGKST